MNTTLTTLLKKISASILIMLCCCFFASPNTLANNNSTNEMLETTTNCAWLNIHNTGCHAVDVYWWQGNGDPDIWYATIQPGQSWSVQTYQGHMWNFYNLGTNSWMDGAMYTVPGCNEYNHNINTGGCNNNANETTNCAWLNIHNTGCHAVDVYWWQGNGDPDIWYATIQPGQSWSVQTYQGHMWNFYNLGTNSWMDGAMYTVPGCNEYNHNINTGGCNQVCDGKITGFKLNPQDGGGLFDLYNGASFCESDFSNDIRIRALVNGNHESLSFHITGPGGTWTNTENQLTYDSKQFWATPGTYHISAKLYSGNDLSGQLCDETGISFTVEDCSPPPPPPTCPVTVTNNGSCAVDVFSWIPSGDVYVGTLHPCESATYTFYSGAGDMIRITSKDCNFSNCAVDESYNVNCNGNLTVTPCGDGCTNCNGQITGFQINPQDGGNLINVNNGMMFCESDFTQDIRIRTLVSGDHESLRYHITGPGVNITNIENELTYDSNQFWANPGTYTINAKLFSKNGADGLVCDEETITIVVQDCTPVCNLNVNINPSGPTNICSDASVTLTANASGSDCGNNISYQWSNGQNGASITVSQAGTYTVTATDCNECTATDQINITVEDCAPLLASLGDYTFIDYEANGIQDPIDDPLPGVEVNLYKADDLNNAIATTTTNGDGFYQFTELDPTMLYVVSFGNVTGFSRTLNTGLASAGDPNDSNADFMGFTDVIDLNPGEYDPTIDAGYIPFRGTVDLKMVLQGPALDDAPAPAPKPEQEAENSTKSNVALMSDELRSEGLIPNNQPYGDHPSLNYDGNETVSNFVLNLGGTDAVIDWVMVELRDKNNPSQIVARKAALLQKDGDVVNKDGISQVSFDVDPDDYYISVCHRNHLAAMTANTVSIGKGTISTVDFTSPSTATYGGPTAQVELPNGRKALWAGNANGDDKIIFQGNDTDNNEGFFAILTAPGNVNTQINYILESYHAADADMNCQLIYQGVNNEPNLNFFNVVTHPENFNAAPNFIIQQKLP